MKILLAPDSFKGTLSAAEVCAIEAKAIREVLPDAQIVSLPLADGGEGTLEAIALARPEAKRVVVPCHDPLMREITAEYLRLPDGTTIIELAQASGLHLLASEEHLRHWRTHSSRIAEWLPKTHRRSWRLRDRGRRAWPYRRTRWRQC